MAVSYGFDHVHLNAVDVEAAAAFYERVFGMRRIRTFEANGVTFAQLDAGGVRITITSRPYQHSGRGNAVDHFALYVPDLDEALADLRAKGVEFRTNETGAVAHDDPADRARSLHLRYAFVRAPDDVAIEILSPATV
jgi:catechol 2,3-dioxygenase-like lactoylglutathione lyase family enzyme